MKECQDEHGLQVESVWFEAFDKLDPVTENYIRNMRANGEKINRTPRILLSTIHGAKGGEADNVLIMSDLTIKAVKHKEKNPDDFHRLFYVAVTRPRKELHIVDPRNYEKAYIL